MTVLPAISRELRAQSRLPFTYGLRVLGAAALLGVSLVFAFNYGFAPNLGGRLFGYLNCTLFFSIWIIVPLLAADCISRERREGTLGLLFLTPLNARDIVLAKGFVHGLRSFSLWIAVLPIITISILIGGVSWEEAASSVLINFSSICWALAAGLLASSLSKTWLRAQILATIMGTCLVLTFMVSIGNFIGYLMGPTYWFPFQRIRISVDQELIVGFFSSTDIGGAWADMFVPLGKVGQRSWLLGEAGMAFFSVILLLIVVEIAARSLRRSWQEEPPSAPRQWLQQRLFTPVIWVPFFRKWMRRKLERNPIGWLEQRTWSGRLVTWSWFAVVMSLYSAALGTQALERAVAAAQQFLSWLLLGSMALSAAGSFHRERESGVMELLLVSPMSVGQIIGGRLRGLWGQFLPAFVLLVSVWVYFAGYVFPGRGEFDAIQFFCGAFLALPAIGLYFSLRCKNFLSAIFLTVLVGLLLPSGFQMLLILLARFFLGLDETISYEPGYFVFGDIGLSVVRIVSSTSFVTLIQVWFAIRLTRLLYRDMARRNFAFSRNVN
ncbi:MAG: hypothetical protein JWR26_3921 [Pedosphaera sp.]|nr:hypothetical protein [Pedosphaera sp.]